MKQVKIKSISKIEYTSKRYDISVADNNNLFANDILIHNCQNIPQVLQQFADKEVYVTEKIDYQSVTFTGKMVPKFGGLLGKLFPIKKYQFVVCSRNMTTNDKNSLYWKIAKNYNIEQILRDNPTLTIQGEQGDTKIQDNKYGITEPRMWVFNIIDHERNYHYSYRELEAFCKDHNLEYVKLVGFGYYKLSDLGSTVQEIVNFSKGKSLLNTNIPREGVVIRCIENGKKLLSCKAINPDFLLKYD
jgi:ATP-dependent RNA circularization protein (DNA/RNA ligase family)